MFGLNDDELNILNALDTPKKIQDFLEKMPINHESNGDTCISPRRVLRENHAHCIEGAMLAALALRIHGHKPLLVDMTAARFDNDHVIAVFQQDGYWGAISKTNHAVLRYREPVYETIRELVMSYFHEYFENDTGRKSLRSFCDPIDLSIFDDKGWMTSEKDVWFVPLHLQKMFHYPIVNRKQIANFRKPDPIEVRIGKITQWKKPEVIKEDA
jgi:hypothetical protein